MRTGELLHMNFVSDKIVDIHWMADLILEVGSVVAVFEFPKLVVGPDLTLGVNKIVSLGRSVLISVLNPSGLPFVIVSDLNLHPVLDFTLAA